ncbi:MAG: hypothetical protein BVN35_13505 [Proteobacteria bacterium ST_bin11]|nr:MAG: hypothetical protein BVN35_13505 [Proteobacteria bacterium ST_bin11]
MHGVAVAQIEHQRTQTQFNIVGLHAVAEDDFAVFLGIAIDDVVYAIAGIDDVGIETRTAVEFVITGSTDQGTSPPLP